MKLGFKKFMNKGQKGITLVELMVVMAILATLATIVFPAVSGTSATSSDSVVKTDAGNVEAAVNDYFADQGGAAEITTDTTAILGAGNVTAQKISTRYPEDYLTADYPEEFPSTDAIVTAITIKIGSTTKTPVDFAKDWTAIDLAGLVSGGYLEEKPKSATSLSKKGSFNTHLWLLKKSTSGDAGSTRSVEVFKLTQVVDAGGTFALTYEQVY